MVLDSDILNADAYLHVEFYTSKEDRYKDTPFVRIIVPGNKCDIVDQPVREDHKQRFPRQWLYYQMANSEGMPVMGTKLEQWCQTCPDELTDHAMAELQILKFQTVEQVATASDSQLQKVGMGGVGLREQARAFLLRANQSDSAKDLETTRQELKALQDQMKILLARPAPVRRVRKEG